MIFTLIIPEVKFIYKHGSALTYNFVCPEHFVATFLYHECHKTALLHHLPPGAVCVEQAILLCFLCWFTAAPTLGFRRHSHSYKVVVEWLSVYKSLSLCHVDFCNVVWTQRCSGSVSCPLEIPFLKVAVRAPQTYPEGVCNCPSSLPMMRSKLGKLNV